MTGEQINFGNKKLGATNMHELFGRIMMFDDFMTMRGGSSYEPDDDEIFPSIIGLQSGVEGRTEMQFEDGLSDHDQLLASWRAREAEPSRMARNPRVLAQLAFMRYPGGPDEELAIH